MLVTTLPRVTHIPAQVSPLQLGWGRTWARTPGGGPSGAGPPSWRLVAKGRAEPGAA